MCLPADMNKKLLITFEGIDGSGKSSLSKCVFDRLSDMGVKGSHTCEPTQSFLGKSIREIVLFSKEKLTPCQQVLLFTADRIAHMEWIQHEFKKVDFVICDRFIHSTLAYQGIDEKVRETIYTIHDLCLKDFYPDVVFLIDIDPVVSLNRIKKNNLDKLQKKEKDRFEKVEFLAKVRTRYLDLANSQADSFEILDGTLPLEKLTEVVLDSLFTRFAFLKKGGKR